MTIKSTQAKRLSPDRRQKTEFMLTAISQITDYKPARAEFAADQVSARQKALSTARAEEIAAQNALDKARDAATKAEWDAYEFCQTAAEQVAAQYGSDSDQYASIGYKKTSEYRKSSPAAKAAQQSA